MLLIVVLGFLLAVLVAVKWLQRGRWSEKGDLVVDGRRYVVELRYGSAWPALLGHDATMVGKGVLCFRGYPRGIPGITPLLVAHELMHVVDRIRRGGFRFWVTVWWDFRLPYRERPTELYAILNAPRLMAETFPGVDASHILSRF